MRIAIAKARRGWGGGTTVALALARGLRERGHDVVVYCHPAARIRKDAAAAGLAVEPVLRGKSLPLWSRLRTSRALRRTRPEVLIAFIAEPRDLRLAVPAAQRARVPVVVRRGLAGPFTADARERQLLAGVRAFVAVARGVARGIDDALPGARTVVIHNGTDVDRFAAAAPADLGLPAGAVALGFVGRLHHEKGIRELAAAWPRVADAVAAAHLLIVGSGPHESELRALLRDARRVHWLGFRADTAHVHRALDVVVLPTHVEGFPNTVVEAMAAGRPVISTLVDGPIEAVEDGRTGRLVPPGDASALAAAMIDLARDAALRRRMGEAGAAVARERFTWEKMIDAYEALLRETVAARAA